MMKLFIIDLPAQCSSGRLKTISEKAISAACRKRKDIEAEYITAADEFCFLAGKGSLRKAKILFIAEIDEGGINLEACKILSYLQSHASSKPLTGSAGAIVIDGRGDMFTKDLGRRIAFAANIAGLSFPGKPLVEASEDLHNFRVLADLWDTDLYSAYEKSVLLLTDKLLDFEAASIKNTSSSGKQKVLAVHAGNKTTSNSFNLWEMIRKNMEDKADIEDISIRNGQLIDCRGCKYDDCLHFGENAGCFYGGVMVEKVYPAIIDCDALVLICPNYNDSVSANIMAFINRLTAVFRAHDFSQKKVFAVIVSGYSGGDIVAQQIIGAINMNKNLILPAGFAMIETAGRPGDIFKIRDIKEKAAKFAANITGL